MTRWLVVGLVVATALTAAACSSRSPSAPAATSAAPADASPLPTTSLGPVQVLGVLGDSISLGVNACPTSSGRCSADAWATGTAAGTVASRLAEETGTTPRIVQAAVDGGDAADAAERASGLAAENPDLVTLLVGANDACAPSTAEMTTVGSFRRDFAEVLSVLDADAPDATVLALSIPDLNQVWLRGKDNARAVQLWSNFSGCRNLLGDPNSSATEADARRRAVADRVVAYNDVIADACASARNCISDGGELYRHQFTVNELSAMDYFHPSSAGQRVIADVAWAALTRQAVVAATPSA